MSDHPQHGGNGGFEREDLSPKAIFGFLIGLALLGILVYFVVNGLYYGLNRYFQSHQAAISPMKGPAETNPRATQTQQTRKEIENTFAEPRLETDERDELNEFRMQEAEQLASYGWVDRQAGVVHIPIEQAMRLVAERGLPVRPPGMNSQASAKTDSSGKNGAAKPAAEQ